MGVIMSKISLKKSLKKKTKSIRTKKTIRRLKELLSKLDRKIQKRM